jgi:four helix bundle protein
VYKFEKLIVWNKSVELIKLNNRLIIKLPRYETNNLIDQLRRATTSISLNIAEGCGSENDIELKRFLNIAKKSQFEAVAIIKIIEKIYKVDIAKELFLTEEIGKLLNGFINKLKQNNKSKI